MSSSRAAISPYGENTILSILYIDYIDVSYGCELLYADAERGGYGVHIFIAATA